MLLYKQIQSKKNKIFEILVFFGVSKDFRIVHEISKFKPINQTRIYTAESRSDQRLIS